MPRRRSARSSRRDTGRDTGEPRQGGENGSLAEERPSSANATIAIAAVLVVLALALAWLFMSGSTGPSKRKRRKPSAAQARPVEVRKELTPAEKSLKGLEMEAEKLAGKGDYDGAIEVLGRIPDEHAGEIGERARRAFEACLSGMRRRGEREIESALGAANRAFHQGAFARALEILDGAAHVRYAGAEQRLTELRARIEKAKGTVESALASRPSDGEVAAKLAAEEQKETEEKRLAATLQAFDRALVRGDLELARKTVADALLGEAPAEIERKLKALEGVCGHVVSLRKSEAKALRALAKEKPELELELVAGKDGKTGKKLTGKLMSVRDLAGQPKIVLHAETAGHHTIHTIPLNALTPALRTKLRYPGEPRSDDERVARALLAAISLDLETARSMLEAASDHPLAERYSKELRKLEGASR